MNKMELSEVRGQLRSHYDVLKVRAKELETEKPVFKEIFDPLNLVFGFSPYYFVVDGYEMRAPRGMRDALKFCESELKWWGTVDENDKRLNIKQHNDDEETE